jgi:hypothetical protein
MKALFTSLMILMINFAFAQSPDYTYNDGVGNQYEVYAGYIKRSPVAPISYGKATSTTTAAALPEKSIEIVKAEVQTVTDLCQAVITANATQGKLNTNATLEYLVDRNIKTIYMKAAESNKVALENKLEEILAR